MERTENMTEEKKAPGSIDEFLLEFGFFVKKVTDIIFLNDIEFQCLHRQIKELKADIRALQQASGRGYPTKTPTYQGKICYD